MPEVMEVGRHRFTLPEDQPARMPDRIWRALQLRHLALPWDVIAGMTGGGSGKAVEDQCAWWVRRLSDPPGRLTVEAGVERPGGPWRALLGRRGS